MNAPELDYETLKNDLLDLAREKKAQLKDSPISLRSHIDNLFGFYEGVCYAKGWIFDWKFKEKMEKA